MESRLELKILHRCDPITWDRQASLLGGGFFHCHASIRYRARLSGEKPLFVEVHNSTGRCVAIAAGTIDASGKWPFSRFCKIASFPTTPVAAGDNVLESWLLENIQRTLKHDGYFKIEIASYHSPNSRELLLPLGYITNNRYEYEFDLTSSEEELFRAFSPNKRNEVRKAEKNGISTRLVTNRDAIELVEELHNLSMARRGERLSEMGGASVAARLDLLESGRIRILVSFLKEEPVCAYLFGIFNGSVYGLRAGSSQAGNKNSASVHLHWTAVKLFKDEDFVALSLGGTREEEVGLKKFKKSLGTKEIFQPSGHKIISGVGANLDALRKKMKR